MQSSYIGYFEGIDEYGRIVVNHDEPNKFGAWFRHTTKIIGPPAKDFIGISLGNLCLPNEFKEGDKVKVNFEITWHTMRETGERDYKLFIKKMTLVG